MGLPVLRTLSLCTCCRHYPGAATGRRLRSSRPAVSAFPENVVGSACTSVLFEACSAFTHVAARTLAPSPICDALYRRLQPFRHLHDCSGCFRLERSPGGACTHWKAPPSHGAHVKRPFGISKVDSQSGGRRTPAFPVGAPSEQRAFKPRCPPCSAPRPAGRRPPYCEMGAGRRARQMSISG